MTIQKDTSNYHKVHLSWQLVVIVCTCVSKVHLQIKERSMGCFVLLGAVVATVVWRSPRLTVPTSLPGRRGRRGTRGRGGVRGGGRVVRRVLGEDGEFGGGLTTTAVLVVSGGECVREGGRV